MVFGVLVRVSQRIAGDSREIRERGWKGGLERGIGERGSDRWGDFFGVNLEFGFSEDDFRQRVFDDALGSKFFEVGDEVAGHGVLDDGFDGDPVVFREVGNGGPAQGR